MQKPNIIFEDNHIIVVVKPHNISTQADDSGDLDMLTILKNFIKERDNKPGNVFLGLVHRLDRPTAGVMVFAKTSKAASRLSKQIKDKEFKKYYLCVVCGRPSQVSGRLNTYLKKDSATNTVKIVPRLEEGAKEAILEYEVVETKNKISLLKINLLTGRSHQIRVQTSGQLNTPIYGDFKYGDKMHATNLGLWAYKIKFEHPINKKELKFIAEPDSTSQAFASFEQTIKELINKETV